MNTDTSNPRLSVRGLSTSFMTDRGRVTSVADVSFDIPSGGTLALVGESGSGKSVTSLGLMGLHAKGSQAIVGGEAWFVRRDGRRVDLLSLPEAEQRRLRGNELAMIFQEPMTSLNPVLTVGEQIAESVRLHLGMSHGQALQHAKKMLDLVEIPAAERRVREYPHQLSGGMRQRVMIALAMACNPTLLIADEPTTALDVTIQAQILELLQRLQAEHGMGMLLITHDLGVVARMAHRVGVMYAGEIVEEAPRAAFFGAPRHPYTRKLFAALPDMAGRGARLETIAGQVPALDAMPAGCRFAARCPFAWERCRAESPAWTGCGGAHRVRCHWVEEGRDGAGRAEAVAVRPPLPGREPAPAAPGKLLEVDDLRVHFPIRRGVLQRVVGHVKAVDGVSLALARGRTLALVGESGCGKTTVGKALLQLIRPSGGSAALDGQELTGLSRSALRPLRRRMQMIFQDPFASLNPRLSVGEIIAEGMNALGVAAASGEREAAIAAMLQQVGLPAEAAQRYPHEFSGGQRQRIAIARALAVQPELIVCDEPTSALDVSVQAQILNLLKSLQDELGLAYLFITHNFAVVEYLAHEVAVMYLGRIVERGSVDDVLRSPRHPYTQALLSAVPSPRLDGGQKIIRLAGETPSPANPPTGCHFHPRCPLAVEECRTTYPQVRQLSASHRVNCDRI